MTSNGKEPEFTSREQFAILNAGTNEAKVQITLYYGDREPVGPYVLKVGGHRTRRCRINDLIFPEAPPLETGYAAVIESSSPIVVQVTRFDTRAAAKTWAGTMAYPC